MYWAQTALDEFTAQPQPRIQDFASVRFDLALAYLGKGDLHAVGEHLVPILRATTAEYRTVPIIGRARSLHTLLGRRPDLAPPTLRTWHPHLTLRPGDRSSAWRARYPRVRIGGPR